MQEAREVAGGSLQPGALEDFLKGLFVTAPASAFDVLGKTFGEHLKHNMPLRKAQEAIGSQLPAIQAGPPLAERAAAKFHELTGTQAPLPGTEPSIAQTTGEFLSPLPGVTKLQAGMKGLKAAGKAVAGALGASAALHTLPNITEEGSVPEQIGKALLGSVTGRGALNVAKHTVPVVAHPLQSLRKGAAHIASLGTEPNVEALKLAEKHGVELPLNVGMRSKALNATSNFLSKSVFASKKFTDSFNRSNKSMLDVVKKNIDISGAEPSTASQNFKDFLSQEQKDAKKLVDVEYGNARKLLNKGDSVIPKHTIDSIHAMKEILTRDIQSPATKKVASYVIKLADSWGIAPKGAKLAKGWEKIADDPKLMGQLIDSFETKAKAIPIEKLEGVRSELGNILGHKQEVLGMENWLKGIRNSITKDFESSANKPYVQEIKKANNFYRESYAARFKEDLAESILTGDKPLYTYGKLSGPNAANNLDILERVAGQSPKAKEVLDALKKAKTREIFNSAFTEEGIKLGNFVRQFEKSEVNQELLKKLMGPEPYKNLSELSKVMREQIDSGKDMLNTSSTAYVASDLSILKKFGTETTAALIGLFSSHPSVAIGALGAAATKIAVPNLISRLMADPKFVQQARAFAIARKNGNMKHSGQLMENLGKHANEILRASAYQPGKESKENKNDE